MNISPICNINYSKPSFGHISYEAIDSFRRASEGYRTSCSSDCDNVFEFYGIEEKPYPRMNEEQIANLENLVKRASGLKKSLITSDRYWEDAWLYATDEKGACIKDKALSLHYKSRDIDGNLKILEKAFEKAEELEKEDVPEMKDVPASHMWLRCVDMTKRVQPEFKNIYGYAYRKEQ